VGLELEPAMLLRSLRGPFTRGQNVASAAIRLPVNTGFDTKSKAETA
jgi:hypothetical protein